MKTIVMTLALSGTFAFAQVNPDSTPAGGTTQTTDANASIGDDTSEPAKSTENVRKDHKNKKHKVHKPHKDKNRKD